MCTLFGATSYNWISLNCLSIGKKHLFSAKKVDYIVSTTNV